MREQQAFRRDQRLTESRQRTEQGHQQVEEQPRERILAERGQAVMERERQPERERKHREKWRRMMQWMLVERKRNLRGIRIHLGLHSQDGGESADLEKHKQFLQEAKLPVCDSPREATAWENGFVPEARGIPSEQLELRIQGSLPPLAYMVSRPGQPTTTGAL